MLKHLLRLDDPSHQWLAVATQLPPTLQSWSAVNVEDDSQYVDSPHACGDRRTDSTRCQQLWERLRFNPALIDLYMNTSVFPQHAKSFEKKLVTSGWDIPLYEAPSTRISDTKNGLSTASTSSKTAKALTTGFSGTNDNRLLLPLTITQQDLPQLAHTNAEVLTYLL